jgi:electron transport complex protein RnfB
MLALCRVIPLNNKINMAISEHELNQRSAAINALLPQTQCGLCTYAGCKPYAEAIARGEVNINQCPPGGQIGVRALSILLDVPELLLNAEHGETRPDSVVIIREAECIGCTKCIQACPVDAIVGASKLMHTVLAEYCTGCNLCIPPCPVDCIDIVII